ncbi:MAG: HAMP domain-containing histidine kinase [Clostridiales bacterium]|jgi:signal transduction histidine kinase|nr:HAMP domain-containing histidine kinase [Clostridiales bacterium]
MRLKTFTATYLLFIAVLFSGLSIASVYLNNSQTNMLRRQAERDYFRISAELSKDIAVLYGVSAIPDDLDLSPAVESLVLSYARYYRGHNIEISIIDLQQENNNIPANHEASFVRRGQEHFIHIAGTLSAPFQYYQLNYYLNITESITNMRNIQRVFVIFFIVFSLIAAFILYFILRRIFKPLDIVAKTSRKIADEHYHERIHIKGSNELTEVAGDFNRMAEKIENQIRLLEEESAGKQRFIDNFAHEIRTPITSIYGNAEYMQRAVLEEGEIFTLTQSIMDKTGQMTEIAGSLLRLATLRNYTPVKTQINIGCLFEDISQLLSKQMNEHGVKFSYKADGGVLSGQEDLIKSLLLNLCLNALKACSPGSGVVSLIAEEENKRTVLSVTDTGSGIPSESLQKVIEPFYRVDKARNRNHGGAGLGLTLCKQIADVHDAEMIIESSVGVGTVVKIIFTTSG